MSKHGVFHATRVLATLIIVFAILCTPLASHAAPQRTTMPVPRSMDELLNGVTLVAFAEVGPVLGCFDVALGTQQATPIDCHNPKLPAGSAGLIFTEFQLIVEEVLLDDGTVAAGNSVIFRSWGLPWEVDLSLLPGVGYPPSLPGDRFLFLLTPASDGAYTPSFSAWGRLIVDGDSLYRSNGTQDPFRFSYEDDPITLTEFKQALADHVASQQAGQIYVPLIRGAEERADVEPPRDLSLLDTLIAAIAAFWQ